MRDHDLPGWKKVCEAKAARRAYWKQCRMLRAQGDAERESALIAAINAAMDAWKAEIEEERCRIEQRFNAIGGG